MQNGIDQTTLQETGIRHQTQRGAFETGRIATRQRWPFPIVSGVTVFAGLLAIAMLCPASLRVPCTPLADRA